MAGTDPRARGLSRMATADGTCRSGPRRGYGGIARTVARSRVPRRRPAGRVADCSDWAIGAFGIGYWVRAGRWRPAIAGVLPLLVGRTGRQRLEGLVASVPLGLLGFGGLILAGFHG